MRVCNHCEGFVPEANSKCPNCEASMEPLKKKGRLSKILYGITVSSAAMTLMACYGIPPCQQECGVKIEELTNCRKKCNEELTKESQIRMLLILDQQSKNREQTNKTQTSSTSNNNSTDNAVDTNSELPQEP